MKLLAHFWHDLALSTRGLLSIYLNYLNLREANWFKSKKAA